MVEYCPITQERVDEKVIRINAFFVFSLIVAYAISGFNLLMYIVLVDFAIRVFLGVKNSPVCKTIKYGLHISGANQDLINAGPKKLASKVGLIFSVLIVLFQTFDMEIAKNIVLYMFIAATFLEVFFKFCLVCKMYPYLDKYINKH